MINSLSFRLVITTIICVSLILASRAYAEVVTSTLNWDAPTTYVSGEPVLAGEIIRYDVHQSLDNFSTSEIIGSTTATVYTATYDLPPGQHVFYYCVSAVSNSCDDGQGGVVECSSDCSAPPVFKVFDIAEPPIVIKGPLNRPSNLTVQ